MRGDVQPLPGPSGFNPRRQCGGIRFARRPALGGRIRHPASFRWLAPRSRDPPRSEDQVSGAPAPRQLHALTSWALDVSQDLPPSGAKAVYARFGRRGFRDGLSPIFVGKCFGKAWEDFRSPAEFGGVYPTPPLSSRPERRGEPGPIAQSSWSMNGSRIALRASGMTSRGFDSTPTCPPPCRGRDLDASPRSNLVTALAAQFLPLKGGGQVGVW